jgi:hypothetical protein
VIRKAREIRFGQVILYPTRLTRRTLDIADPRAG